MNHVEEFILNQDQALSELLQFVHHYLIEEFGLEPKLRYKIPFYFSNTWICYLNPLKSSGIELAFLNGLKLSNEHGLLDAQNRKMVAGIKIDDLKTIPLEAIHGSVIEAMKLANLKDSKE